MAGEGWRRFWQVGKEVTYGTPVAATRRMYFQPDSTMSRARTVNRVTASTGTRDQVVDAKTRAVTAAGSISMMLGADEITELLLMSIKGGVTPTSAPATTPTVQPASFTNATTGGTIAAGVISARYTVVYPAGESQALNVVATTTTTTGTSTVTIGAVTPLPAGATAVKYYITLPGGAVGTATYAGTNATGASITLTAPGDGTTLAPTSTPTPVQTWVFTPGTTLDSGTFEWYDGYRAWQEAGVYVNQLRIARGAGVDSDIAVTADLFGKDAVVLGTGMTPALTERVPDTISGWETAIYIDPFGGTAGTTIVSNSLISADLTFNNNMGRKYFGDNTVATGAITSGALEITGQLTFEANAATYTEYQNWDNATKRLVRLRFGNNVPVGTGTAKKTVDIDIPGVWEAVDLTPEDANTKVYRFNLGYVRDPVNAFPVRFTLTNSRATAY